MADPLFLSLWVKDPSPLALPVYFRKAIEVFPFSRLATGGVLRVHAISFNEAAIYEEWFDDIPEPRSIADAAQQFLNGDVAFSLETKWDLWSFDGDWALKPSPITIECYAPLFDSPLNEQIRLDAGPEYLFLPHPSSDQLRPTQSNIRSLLHLASDLEDALAASRVSVWSENTEDLASRLETLLS